MTTEPNMPFAQWAASARASSVVIWGYDGLIDDDPEEAVQAWLHGEDPERFILELGEGLDLFKATKYWLGAMGV